MEMSLEKVPTTGQGMVKAFAAGGTPIQANQRRLGMDPTGHGQSTNQNTPAGLASVDDHDHWSKPEASRLPGNMDFVLGLVQTSPNYRISTF